MSQKEIVSKTKMTSEIHNENKEMNDSEKEISYQAAVKLMKSINCMTAYKAKVDMYKEVALVFSKLTDYKDSEEFSKVCEQLAEQTNKEIEKRIYKRAQMIKNSAKFAEDYLKAAEEFKKVSGYRDAADMFSECNQLSISIGRKAKGKRYARNLLVILCIAAIIVGASTSHAKYYLANAYSLTGSYDSAINIYKKLGAYKDCKERLIENQYLKGLDSEEKGDFISAEKAFTAAGDYKDSEDQKVESEKLMIINSTVGSTVKVGNFDWIILEAENGKALLMKDKALQGMAYNQDLGDVTWEKATLRQWLNSEFLNKTFSAAERNNIILINLKNDDNAVYDTNGGNDTQDYIFLLSIDEAEKYNSLFPTFTSNSWLRTPGYNQSSAAFLSVKGAVMDYGYVTTSEDFNVRPILWFNIE